MPTPPFILAIRESYGHGLLLLSGVSAVVLDPAGPEQRLLLVRRADTGRWGLPAGIVEPGEQPADALVREVLEETCVHVRPERLALLHVDDTITYPNGDQCQYVALTFRCRYLGGQAHVGDEESSEVGWFELSGLPDIGDTDRRRVTTALPARGATAFDVSPVPQR